MTNLFSKIKIMFTQGLVPLIVIGLVVLLAPGGLFAQSTIALDDSTITPPGVAVTIDVVVNDTPGTGNLNLTGITYTYPLNGGPQNGTVGNNLDGTFTYTPNTNFSGPDSFDYTVCDSAPTPLCDTATVSVIVANEVSFNVIPRKLNVKKKGVLPVVIYSSEDFDVNTIDHPESLMLEGVLPLRWNMASKKLTLKFSAPAIVAAIEPVNDRDVVVLQLTGLDVNGVAIIGEDPVIIIKKGNP